MYTLYVYEDDQRKQYNSFGSVEEVDDFVDFLEQIDGFHRADMVVMDNETGEVWTPS